LSTLKSVPIVAEGKNKANKTAQTKKIKNLKNFQKMLAKAILPFIIVNRVKPLGLFSLISWFW
jgi:hypothetical protein